MRPASYDIRVEPANTPHALELAAYAFASSPVELTEEEKGHYFAGRADDKGIVSYVDDVAVAKAAIIPMTMNLRGTVMPMGGIGGVCSMPVARRGGHARALMLRAIEEMHADGQAISTLYPFKTSYYETFGYAGWQAPLWATIKPIALAPYLAVPKSGPIRQRISKDARDDLYALIQAQQQRVHGMGCLPRVRFDHNHLDSPAWFVSVHEGDAITGGLVYTMDMDKVVMNVRTAIWLTGNARFHLLDFIARHVDQVADISLPLPPGEHPHLWLTDDNAVSIWSTKGHDWHAPMGRIVTMTGLNGIGAGDGSVTLAVRDTQAPWNDGIWTFTGSRGGLEILEGGNPQGEVYINGLSAMVMSGLDPDWLPARRWGSLDPQAADACRSLFPPVIPHLHESF